MLSMQEEDKSFPSGATRPFGLKETQQHPAGTSRRSSLSAFPETPRERPEPQLALPAVRALLQPRSHCAHPTLQPHSCPPHSHPQPMAAARTGGLGLAGLPWGNSTCVSAGRADGIQAEPLFPAALQQPRELRNRRLLTTHTVKNSLQRKTFSMCWPKNTRRERLEEPLLL